MKSVVKIGAGCLVLCVIGCGGETDTDKSVSKTDKAALAETKSHWNDAERYYYLGREQIGKGETDAAIQSFNEAIKIDPSDASAYYFRGRAWEEKGELGEAIADYTEAIRIDPKNANYYMERGDVWTKEGKYDKAIENYTDAIKSDPGYGDAYFRRGNQWESLGEHDTSIEDYTEAIKLDPNDTAAYLNRSNAWRKKGQHDKVDADLLKYNMIHGLRCDEEGSHWSAIRHYGEAIKIQPKHAEAYYNRGKAWSAKGDKAKAEADFKEAKRLDPKIELDDSMIVAEPVRLKSTMSFPVAVPAANAGGLAFDGKSLWVSVQSVRAPDRLMKYSLEGKLLLDVALASGNIGGGLAYDGNEFHVLDYRTKYSGNGAIHKVNAEGKIVKSHALPKDRFNTFGLTYAKRSIYYGHSPTVRPAATIYRIGDMMQKSEVTKVPFYVRGLAFDGESFWVSTNKEIHRVDEEFNILNTYIPDIGAGDLAWADGALWAVELNKNRVHRFDIPKDK